MVIMTTTYLSVCVQRNNLNQTVQALDFCSLFYLGTYVPPKTTANDWLGEHTAKGWKESTDAVPRTYACCF